MTGHEDEERGAACRVQPDFKNFDEPWQAYAFALTVALVEGEQFDWPKWTKSFARFRSPAMRVTDSQSYEVADYYDDWLSNLLDMAKDAGLASPDEVRTYVDQWRRAYERTPHGQPVRFEAGA